MAKPFKIVLVILGLLVTLVVVAAVGLVMTFDPNDYRDDIEQAVEDTTGRDLRMTGPLSLSIFPWLGVETESVSLGNAEGFGNEAFAEIGYFGVSIRLLPLLSKQIEIGTVRLEGMRLNLARDENGRTNWDDLIEAFSDEDGEAEAPVEEPTPSTEGGFEITGLSVEAVEIEDAAVKWTDAAAGQSVVLKGFNLSTGRISPSATHPVPLSMNFVVEVQEPKTTLSIDLVTKLVADLDASQFSVEDLRLEGTAEGADIPAGKQQFNLAANINFDQEAGVLKLADLVLQAAGVTLNGSLDGSGLNSDSPSFNGQITSQTINPRTVFRSLAIDLPETQDETTLKSAGLDARFSATTQSAELRKLTVTLDDTTLTGTAAVKDFETMALAFDLDVDQFNLDRYLPPSSEEEDTGSDSDESTGDINDIELPLDALEGLNVDGRFAIKTLVASGLTFDDATLIVKGKPGQPLQQSLTAKAYGGDIRIDNRVAGAASQAPSYRFQGSLDQLLFGDLLQDLVDKDWLQGKGLVTYDLTSQGRTVGDLRKHLSGTLKFGLSDGAIKGIDISRVLTAAEAKLRGQSADAESGGETRFNKFGGSMSIKDGVAKTTDFSAGADNLNVTATGSVNLVAMTLDYALKPVLTAAPSDSKLGALVGKAIPVTVTGPVTSPKIGIDIKGLLKAEAQQRLDEEKAELREKADKEKERLQEKIDEEKERARDKLRDKLGGFLNRKSDTSSEQSDTDSTDGGS